MKWSRAFVFAAVLIASTLSATAQEQVRLQFEVSRGSLVAKPELRVASGSEGLIVAGTDPPANSGLAGTRERIVVVPTVRGNDVEIRFTIISGDREFRPSLVISDAIRGSLEWPSIDGQPVRLTVTWIR
jgi:hypothetical protein